MRPKRGMFFRLAGVWEPGEPLVVIEKIEDHDLK